MTVVILAEKSDQGKKFASALAGKAVRDSGGKIEFKSEIFGDTVVTWGIGHLVGLSLPEKYEWLQNVDNAKVVLDVNGLEFQASGNPCV